MSQQDDEGLPSHLTNVLLRDDSRSGLPRLREDQMSAAPPVAAAAAAAAAPATGASGPTPDCVMSFISLIRCATSNLQHNGGGRAGKEGIE